MILVFFMPFLIINLPPQANEIPKNKPAVVIGYAYQILNEVEMSMILISKNLKRFLEPFSK